MPEARTSAMTLADIPEVIHVRFEQWVVLEIDIPDVVCAEGARAGLAFGAKGRIGRKHGEEVSHGKILVRDDFLNLLSNLLFSYLRVFRLLRRTLDVPTGTFREFLADALLTLSLLRLFFRCLFF